MIWLITIIVILCAIFYYKAVRQFSYWKDRGVIHKEGSPIIRILKQLLFQKVSLFDSIYNQYQEFSNERYFGSFQLVKPTLFVNDLDLIKKITVKDYEYFIDHNNIISEDLEPLMGKNLINLKGQRWRDMRATLSPSFTSSKMKMMFTLISECAEEFTDYFEKQKLDFFDVEMKDVFTRFTNDAIANVAFGFKCNSLKEKDNEFYMMGKKLTTFSGSSFIAFVLYSVFPALAKVLNIRIFPKPAITFFSHIVKDTLNKREKEGLVRPDMIHLLMEARKNALVNKDMYEPDATTELKTSNSETKHKIELSEEDITAQAIVFISGGFDTSSTLLSFIAYELAMNNEVQKKLQEEIDETLNACNGKLTYESVHTMKYMDMVVSETLRKWPPGFVLDRYCVKDYLIEPVNSGEKPFLIEKGTMVQMPIVGIHRDPKYFSNPDTFDPERFNDENKNSIEHFTYLPFGSGPRNCIASRFALMENKILIFHLLSKFDIVKTTKTPYPLKMAPNSFNLGPAEGFWLGLKRRDST
ncbi:hypothetical protein RN001_013366 [Aquatica leii]|uniref:Cytochrome P450 n=1 Tax=Aquatica leii TaxID=1421715 RepID=A0AAN7S6Z0_9COLE|nr:hypothetical protein RN001_013366 [Aquatica leii]